MCGYLKGTIKLSNDLIKFALPRVYFASIHNGPKIFGLLLFTGQKTTMYLKFLDYI